jgi:TPP-dependent pyruvate/acetoin dehydrogenase alpha subunit
MGSNSKRVSKTAKPRSKQNRESPLILPAAASLEPAKLKQVYSTMLGCRMLNERIRRLASQGILGPDLPVGSGFEALEVGALINLAEDDCVASGRRDYMARFINGMPLRTIFAGLSRHESAEHRKAEFAEGKNVGPILPWSSPAAQLNQLTGAAWAFRLQKCPQAAIFISADPSAWGDTLHDAVSVSAAYKLPVVYIVSSGHVDDPGSANPNGQSQERESSAFRSALPSFLVDVTDAVAVYRVAQEAIRRARQGHGPAFIECKTWAPATSSSNTDTRSSEDPLSRMEAHLSSKKLWSERWKMKLAHTFTRQLDRATTIARQAAQPLRTASTTASSSITSAPAVFQAESGEGNSLEAHIVRDTSRLAGSRG